MTERDIFLAVLDLPDAAARIAYLESTCGGDSARRARVEALLQAHENAGSFLAEPAAADHGATEAFSSTPDADGTQTAGGTSGSEDEPLSFLTPPRRPDSLGRIGHYEVLEVLGRGGFGIVFRAFDDVLQRVVAVKVLAPTMAATSPARKRFLREARSSAQVRHENVVQVYAVEEQPLPYLVMEFIPGETLQQRLDRTGPLDVPEVLRIGRQIAEGLAAAHAQGLIHRDVKPANVLIEGGPAHRAKLTDFGLARAADDASISQSGVVAGTPMYMAPEQAKGETLDHRADLFSLGSVLYVMCSGRPPFRASGTLAVLKRVCEEDPRPIREVIPEVPDWLCRIVETLHAKDPAERLQTAREVADLFADCETQWKAHGTVKDKARIPKWTPDSPKRFGFGRFAITAIFGIAAGVSASLLVHLHKIHAPWLALGLVYSALFLFIAFSVLSAARKARGRKFADIAFAALLIAITFWVGPTFVRYFLNQGEVEFEPQPGLNGIIVLQNDAVVHDWMDLHNPQTLSLSAGQYQLNMGLKPGYDYPSSHWEVEKHWLFGGSKLSMPGSSVQVTVAPGEQVTIRAVPRSAPELAVGLHVRELPMQGPLWIKLFNGENLNGWSPVGSNSTWKADGGILRGSGPAGYLVSERAYGDFHFKAEVRITPGTDFGVLFHTDQVAPPTVVTEFGFGVEIKCPGPIGDVHGQVSLAVKATGQLLGGRSETSVSPTAWLPLDVIVQGETVKVNVAGSTLVCQFRSPNKAGPIVLWLAGNGAAAELRRVAISTNVSNPGSDAEYMALETLTGIAGTWESVGGPVTLEHGPIEGRSAVTLSGSYLLNDGKNKGVITRGTYYPFKRTAQFEFAEPWWGGTGSVELTLSADGNELGGTWRNSKGEGGVWPTMRRPQPSAAESGWVQIFNGKDLTGWKTHPDEPGDWRVDDGILIGSRGASYLFSDRGDYENAHIRVEAKINKGGNSGVLFHSKYGFDFALPVEPVGTRVPLGYEVEFASASNISAQRTGSVFRCAPPLGMTKSVAEPIADDTWTVLDIIVRGNHIVTRVNGQPATDFVDTAAPIVRGHIALQVHGPETVVRFRKIEIKELPPADRTAAPPAAVFGGGQQIAGWGTPVDPLGDCKFTAENGGLTITVPGGQHNLHPAAPFQNVAAPRVLQKAKGDFDLQVQVLPSERPKPGTASNGINNSFVAAGLLVWRDSNNFVRWLRAANGDTGRLYSSLEVFRQGKPTLSKFYIDVPDRATFLRIERHDGRLSYQYSTDGSKWAVAPGSGTLWDGELDVGVAAVNTTTAAYVARFGMFEFKNLAAPPSPPPAVAPFDAAKAKEYQEVWAKHLGAPVEMTNSVGMKFRLIPPGEFTMGSSPAEIDWLLKNTEYKSAPSWVQDGVRSEGPDRRVTVPGPFYLGTYEVTVGQFREFTRATGYKTEAETNGGGSVWNTKAANNWDRKPAYVWTNPEFSPSESHPVVFITPRDARAFCKWLGEKDGRRYDVPTEEQWEWACRAGTATRWFFGDDATRLKEFGWTSPNSAGLNHPVGRLAPNPFGLYDMYGNATELAITPQGQPKDRGGDAGGSAWRARSASCFNVGHPDETNFRRGFRVAIVGDLKPKTPAEKPSAAVVQALRELVAAKDRALKTTQARVGAGQAPAVEQTLAQIELIEAQIRLAEVERDHAAVLSLLKDLVARREDERRNVETLIEAGRATPGELDQVDARLAEAKTRLAQAQPAAPGSAAPTAKPPHDATKGP